MDNEVIVAIIGFLGIAFGYLFDEFKTKRKDNNAIQRALKIILRKDIKTFHDNCVRQGYITHLELQEFQDTIDVYNILIGNNGYVDDIESKINSLEVR